MQPSASNPLRIGFSPSIVYVSTSSCNRLPYMCYRSPSWSSSSTESRELSSVSTIWAPLASLRSRLENCSHFSSIIMMLMLMLMLCLIFRPMLRYVIVSYRSFRISYARVPSLNCNQLWLLYTFTMVRSTHKKRETLATEDPDTFPSPHPASIRRVRTVIITVFFQPSWSLPPVTVAVVTEWPHPRDWKEVQLFLGFVNFYQWFIKRFSHIAWPMFNLTKKDAPFVWYPECDAAFAVLKAKVTEATTGKYSCFTICHPTK